MVAIAVSASNGAKRPQIGIRIAAQSFVRIRILSPTGGILDGVNLSYLLSGLTYDVGASVADHLVTMGVAQRIRSTDFVEPSVEEAVNDELMHGTQGVRVSGPALIDRAVAYGSPPTTSRRRRP